MGFTDLDLKGSTTVTVYGLNRQACTTGRRSTWLAMLALIKEYARLKDADDHDGAAEHLTALVNQPFQSVRAYLAVM